MVGESGMIFGDLATSHGSVWRQFRMWGGKWRSSGEFQAALGPFSGISEDPRRIL